MTLIVLFFIFILLKFVIVFVDGIVGQVHIEIIQVRVRRPLVFLSRKSRKTHLMEVDAQWVNAIKEDVYPEVEFQIVYQVWLSYISLNDTPLIFTRIHDFLQTAT